MQNSNLLSLWGWSLHYVNNSPWITEIFLPNICMKRQSVAQASIKIFCFFVIFLSGFLGCCVIMLGCFCAQAPPPLGDVIGQNQQSRWKWDHQGSLREYQMNRQNQPRISFLIHYLLSTVANCLHCEAKKYFPPLLAADPLCRRENSEAFLVELFVWHKWDSERRRMKSTLIPKWQRDFPISHFMILP